VSHPQTIWVHEAKLKSSVLLVNPQQEIKLKHGGKHRVVLFAQPEQVTDDERWSGWERSLRTTWLYPVSIEFVAADEEEAIAQAYRNLENLVCIMSFLASSPVKVESYGHMRNPPGEHIVGQTYNLIGFEAESGFLVNQPAVIDEEGLRNYLTPLFMSDVLLERGGDRIARSLRWLQRSYEASTVTDEFLYLPRLLGDRRVS
jgi:hypothetical protein